LKTRFYFISILFSLAGVSQEQDSVFVSEQFNLQEVTIIGNRLQGNADIAPLATTQLDSALISQPVQQLSIKEQLLQVPGLYIQNANNFAQDARISIRGFGANAAFGIRGIK